MKKNGACLKKTEISYMVKRWKKEPVLGEGRLCGEKFPAINVYGTSLQKY